MEKRIAVLLALMIGFTYWPSEAVVMAAGNEEPAKVEESKDVTAEEKIEKNQDTTGKETEDTETMRKSRMQKIKNLLYRKTPI